MKNRLNLLPLILLVRTTAILTVLPLLFSGCATMTHTGLKTQTTSKDIPSVDSVATSPIGETMVSRYEVTTGEGLRLSGRVSYAPHWAISGSDRYFLNESDAFYKGYLERNPKQKCYGPFPFFHESSGAAPMRGSADICFSVSTNSYITFFASGVSPYTYRVNLTPQQNISVEELVVVNEANFKQEFIYSGRVGDSLRFVYREFSGNFIRPSFTQEVQYDANDKIIGFKKMKIEVIKAGNQEIVYKLIENF